MKIRGAQQFKPALNWTGEGWIKDTEDRTKKKGLDRDRIE